MGDSDDSAGGFGFENGDGETAKLLGHKMSGSQLSNRVEKGKRRFDVDGGGEGVLPWPVRMSTALHTCLKALV